MSDYLAVIAIDFGTTFSGYAFSMRSDKNDIKMNKNWGAEAGFQGYKTPTTVLLKPDGNIQSFGFQAESDFVDLDEEEIAEGYLLFQRFKMELYNKKKLDSAMKIKSTNGTERPALSIISMAIRFIKQHCLDAISKALARDVTEKDIRWVITVPAIWNDTAKKLMRLAAKTAGLVDNLLSPNLIVALEPEAASLYCRTLAMGKFVGKEGTKGHMAVNPGEKYIIVDCGGGTIDITVHEMLEDEKVQEVTGASGGPWGGIYVDKKYYELLDDIFGTDFMNTLRRDDPGTWLGMVVDFETKKRAANPGNKTGVNLIISLQFAKMFEQYAAEDVLERIKMKKHLGVKFSNGMLRVSMETVRKMYSEITAEIAKHMKSLLSENNVSSASKLYLVGAFGESAYIQELFTSQFGKAIDIYTPEEAGMCVVKGAVLYGHNADAVTSRISRFNYSCSVLLPFKTGEHDPTKMQTTLGVDRIARLETLVITGQRLQIDAIVKTSRIFGDPSDTRMQIDLYCTENNDTDDPHHPSVMHLEQIIVDSPNVSKKDRTIEVSLCFGCTDILFKATDLDSGNEAISTVQL